MNLRFEMVLAGFLALLSSRPIPAGDGVKEMKLDHRTLSFQAQGLQRFELCGSLAGDSGEAKLWRTVYPKGNRLNVYGDRIDDPSEESKTTEHDVKLERMIPGNESEDAYWVDASPAKDRILYRVKGIDLGVNRSLLLMVSSKGPQRLIYLGRCGGVWAAALEPRSAFDGPIMKRD
jgi:hypothetical protein